VHAWKPVMQGTALFYGKYRLMLLDCIGAAEKIKVGIEFGFFVQR
jgi:hypothetical protein